MQSSIFCPTPGITSVTEALTSGQTREAPGNECTRSGHMYISNALRINARCGTAREVGLRCAERPLYTRRDTCHDAVYRTYEQLDIQGYGHGMLQALARMHIDARRSAAHRIVDPSPFRCASHL